MQYEVTWKDKGIYSQMKDKGGIKMFLSII